MSPLLLGIDAGTSSVKIQIVDATGRTVSEAARPLAYKSTADGGTEFDPDLLWEVTLTALGEALNGVDNRRNVAGIACAGVGESGVLVGDGGEVLCPSLAWYDERPAGQVRELIERHGATGLSRQSGMSASPIAGLCKLMWMRDHHQQALSRARHWLPVSSFLAYRLSGVAAVDFSLAGRTLLLDLADKCWNLERLGDAGIPDHLLPPLTDNGKTIGSVLPDLAATLGLRPDVCVVNGGHDHVVGALACGVFGSDAMLDSLGTAEAVMLPIQTPVDDQRQAAWGIEQGMLSFAGEPLYYLLGGLNAASASVDWFRAELADNTEYEHLCAGAEDISPGADGVVFLPFLRGMSAPDSRPGNHGAFFNIGTGTTRSHMYRAVVEGLAYDARKIAEGLVSLTCRRSLPLRVLVTGGSSRNELLMRLKAAVYDRSLDVVLAPQSASLGAAILAGIGAGVFANWHEAVAQAGAGNKTRPVIPDREQIPQYQTMFAQRYLPAVEGLQTMVELQS